jgi:hypothetical protein
MLIYFIFFKKIVHPVDARMFFLFKKNCSPCSCPNAYLFHFFQKNNCSPSSCPHSFFVHPVAGESDQELRHQHLRPQADRHGAPALLPGIHFMNPRFVRILFGQNFHPNIFGQFFQLKNLDKI